MNAQIAVLQSAGLIAIEGGGNRRAYRLSVNEVLTSTSENVVPASESGVHTSENVVRTSENVVLTNRKEPEVNRKEPQNARAREPKLEGFEEWYEAYPNKVARGAAERAWPAARKLASLAELKDGLARYIATKDPEYRWCGPAVWLNQKRWLDQPAKANGHDPPPPPSPERVREIYRQRMEDDAKTLFAND